MESIPSLNDAIEALRNKDKPRAREILDAVIRQDPQNDTAWMYMAVASENRKQALACLERATQINPANNKAWELLEKLESQSTGRNQKEVTASAEVKIRMSEYRPINSTDIVCIVATVTGIYSMLFAPWPFYQNWLLGTKIAIAEDRIGILGLIWGHMHIYALWYWTPLILFGLVLCVLVFASPRLRTHTLTKLWLIEGVWGLLFPLVYFILSYMALDIENIFAVWGLPLTFASYGAMALAAVTAISKQQSMRYKPDYDQEQYAQREIEAEKNRLRVEIRREVEAARQTQLKAEQEIARIAEDKQRKVEAERQAKLKAEQEATHIAAEKQREVEAARQTQLKAEQEIARIAEDKQRKVEAERQAKLNVKQEVAHATAGLEDDTGPDPDNLESKQAYALMKGASPCIFITGKAGTGKTFLLKYFMQKTDKRVVLLAPTGMAALNIGGQTIHSFFKFPPRIINLDEITSARERELYRRVDTIVIDEVSMVNANLMDGIDAFMRKNGRDFSKPFGGAQIILFGDLFQLPPVVTSQADHEYFSFHYASEFFFDARVFKELPIQIVELQKNYRQQDQTFIDILNAVRTNQLTDSQQAILNRRYNPAYIPPKDDIFTVLTTTNKTANLINSRELHSLPSEEYTYTGELEGKFDEKSLPIDTVLKLKKGAQVMFAKNDAAGRWINGTFGKVVDLDKDYIEVEVRSNEHPFFTYRVEREIWQNCRYKFDRNSGRITTEEIGRFLQYPLKLAWAITIHKSQGQTLNKVIIDLTGGVFEHGQIYVALSRCRTLEGMVLKTEIWKNDVLIVRSRVKEFMNQVLLCPPVQEAKREPAARATVTQQRASGVEPLVSGVRSAASGIARLPFEPEMILIPAGKFLMGSDPQKDKEAIDTEQPQHTLYLPDYWIAKTPVTSAQYAAFVQATGHRVPLEWRKGKIPQGKDTYPVVGVTWHDAMAYCKWLAEATGEPYTLPSEAEWEKAARGTDGRIYPWGNTFDRSKCNTFESDFDDMTPVEKYSRGASPYGVLDMAGNVWEWTRSRKQAYPYDPTDGREDVSASTFRVVRGGSVLSDQSSARCAARDRDDPDHGSAIFGFRVVVSPSRA